MIDKFVSFMAKSFPLADIREDYDYIDILMNNRHFVFKIGDKILGGENIVGEEGFGDYWDVKLENVDEAIKWLKSKGC